MGDAEGVLTTEPNHLLDPTSAKEGIQGREAGMEALGGQIERPTNKAPLLVDQYWGHLSKVLAGLFGLTS